MAVPENQDNTTELMIVIGAISVIVLVAFLFMQSYIVTGTLWLAEWKFRIAGHLLPDPRMEQAATLLRDMPLQEKQDMSYEAAFSILGRASRYYAYLAGGLLAFAAFSLLMRNPKMRFRRTFNMERLLAYKANYFPSVRPVVGLNLHKTPTFKGPWRVADNYLMYALRHGLLAKVSDPDTPITQVNRETQMQDREFRVFRMEAARNVMAQQLGLCLTVSGMIDLRNYHQWPAQHRAIMAALLLFRFGGAANAGRAAGLSLFAQFSTGFWFPNYKKMKGGKPPISVQHLDMNEVNEILAAYLGVPYQASPNDYKPKKAAKDRVSWEPPKDVKSVREIRKMFARHGWLNTVMIALLERARERGILVTSEFVWLRPLDRTLFYTLNNVGRNNAKNATALVEGGGAMAHYMVEDTLGRRCLEPEVNEAVYALHKGLAQEGWLPERYLKHDPDNPRGGYRR